MARLRGHHFQHLNSAKIGVLAKHVDAVGLIGHQFETRSLGVNDLTTADRKALGGLSAGTQRIVDAYEGRAG